MQATKDANDATINELQAQIYYKTNEQNYYLTFYDNPSFSSFVVQANLEIDDISIYRYVDI